MGVQQLDCNCTCAVLHACGVPTGSRQFLAAAASAPKSTVIDDDGFHWICRQSLPPLWRRLQSVRANN
jgi:hypothetical protein